MYRIIGLLCCCGLAAAILWAAHQTRAEEYFSAPNPFESQDSHGVVVQPESPSSEKAEANPFADQTPAAPIVQPGSPYPVKGEVKPVAAEMPATPVAKPEWSRTQRSRGGTDVSRRRVDDFMRQARLTARQGDTEEALRLAITAQRMALQFKVTFNPGEQSPAQLVAAIKNPAPNDFTVSAGAAAAPAPLAGNEAEQRKYVQLLLESARQHLQKKNFEAARRDAEQAKLVDLKYSPFEISPQQVLDEIARLQPADPQGPSERFVAEWEKASLPEKADQQPADAWTPPVAKTDKEQAEELLRLAREAIGRGHLNEARSYALEAQKLDVEFGLLDDTPRFVLDEIGRKSNTAIISPDPNRAQAAETDSQPIEAAATDTSDPGTPTREQAEALLKQARSLLAEGQLDAARQKAVEAEHLDADYPLFSDRPELVLQDIQAAEQKHIAADTPQIVPNSPPLPAHTAAPSDDQQRAAELLAEAREHLAHKNFAEARARAEAAAQLDVVYELFDDRPELVLEDIDRLSASTKGQQPADAIAETPAPWQTPKVIEDAADPRDDDAEDWDAPQVIETTTTKPEYAPDASPSLTQDFPPEIATDPSTELTPDPTPQRDEQVVNADTPSARELIQQGVRHLRAGDRAAAYESFLQAHNNGEKLSPWDQRQLQDKLRALAPYRNVQQASGFLPAPGEPSQELQSKMLGEVVERHAAKYDRTRDDVFNTIFQANRLRDEQKPAKALELLDRALADLEGADLPPQQLTSLNAALTGSRESISAYMSQRQPLLDLERRNAETRDRINTEIEYEIRIDQEIADLVEKYNRLMAERRFAEAHTVAKQARELDHDNPVTIQMDIESKYAYRSDRNETLKERKDDSFWNQLNDVEEAAIANVGDRNPIDYDVKRWGDIISKRETMTGARERSVEELRVEESLKRQVSLHFDAAPLTEVMANVANNAGINVVIDELGLLDEQVTTETPISINVEGIKLSSALNLILKPMNLAYTIEDEVLKITSAHRQEGEYLIETYPVGDLIVRIPAQVGTQPLLPMGGMTQPVPGLGLGGPMNIAATGGFQSQSSQGFHQIPDNGGYNAMLGLGGFPGQQNLSGPAPDNHDFQGLTELITTTVAPEMWMEYGGDGSIGRHPSTLSLVIRQTQRVHQEIADLLTQLRRLQDLQVTIEVRFITVSDRFFERIGIDFDFNVNDDIGGPFVDNQFVPIAPFGVVDPINGQLGGVGNGGQQGQAGAQAGAQAGQGGGGAGGGGLGGGAAGGAAGGAGGGGLGGGAAGGAAGQGGGVQGQGGQIIAPSAPFSPGPLLNTVGRDSWGDGVVVGMVDPETFSSDLDIPFRQGSFELGIPEFGGFDPQSGIRFGMAILSDIEAFLFVQAAQGDERSNLMFAPKITLFNGQIGSVSSFVARPFVTQVIPVVSAFAVGFQPVITPIPDGIFMTVQAVVSADRRYVRLAVSPNFQNVTDVFTFSFVSGAQPTGIGGTAGGGGGIGGGGIGGGGGGGLGGGGFGGGGFGGGGGGGGFGGGGIGGQGGGIGGGGIGGQGGGIGGQGGGLGGQGGGIGGAGGGTGGGSITVQQPVSEIVNVNTVVSVPDGGTVLLGGIKRLREGRSMNGVPILNKIPYISRLFKNTGVGRETESLMLMVTPRIIIQEEEEENLGLY